MPLGKAEAFVYDYIKSNHDVREFWDGKIAALRERGLNDLEASKELSDMLLQAYATPEAVEELTGLIGQLDLMLLDWKRLAAMLLGRDIEAEIRAATSAASARPGRPLHLFPAATLREMTDASLRYEAKAQEYDAAIKKVKRLQRRVVLASLLLGSGVAAWLWLRAPTEFSWARLGASIVLALVVAFVVMLIPAWCVEQLRPRRKPDRFSGDY